MTLWPWAGDPWRGSLRHHFGGCMQQRWGRLCWNWLIPAPWELSPSHLFRPWELAVGQGREYLHRGSLTTLQASTVAFWRIGLLAPDFRGQPGTGRFEEVLGTTDKGVAREGGQGSPGIVDPEGQPHGAEGRGKGALSSSTTLGRCPM